MKNYKFLITPLAITLIIAMDQMSKLFLIQYLKSIQGMKISLLSFLDLVFSWNYGISFGLMSNYYQYGNKALLIANSCILIYIFYLLCQSKQKLEILGFACVIGGAIGNLIDRVIHGAVFDFIRVYYEEYYFPVFNIADSFISIGAFLIIIATITAIKPSSTK